MDKLDIGMLAAGASLLLIALRVQIGVALGVVSFLGIAAILSWRAAWGMVTAVPFNVVGDWNLTAIPMFLLMGYIASSSGLTRGLFRAMRILLSRLPGGLAVASVGACALFSAASGSSVATSAAMARIATPQMLKYRYDPGLASGVIASAGTLGSLIPPSILMVLYGYFAEVSIAELFMAGFLPGLLSAILYSAMIIGRVMVDPSLAPQVQEHFSRDEKLEALKDIWPLPVLILAVLAGIFVGFFTPTEAGAVGAFLAILLSWWRGALRWSLFLDAIVKTLSGTASIFIVVIGTILLARLMALSGLPAAMAQTLLSFGSDPLLVIMMVWVLYLVLGCFLDSMGLMLLTLPIILPVARELDFNLVWFCIVLVKLLEIGMVTPPVGLNVYVMKASLGELVPLTKIFRGVTWFIITDLVTLVVIVLFPWISLFLPSLMAR